MIPDEKRISVTEAARGFADCVNRVVYQNQSFLLTRNNIPVARLVPMGLTRCTGADLSNVLANLSLSDAAAVRWKSDIKKAKRSLKKPIDKWR